MTNHVHILATPVHDGAVSKLMQVLNRNYVCYYNEAHGRSGTLWEGRFKSCLVESARYLLHCYRYIETALCRRVRPAAPGRPKKEI